MTALELALLDVSRMEDAKMVGNPNLQVTLTLLKYGRGKNLETVLRSLFEWLSGVLSPQQAKNLLDTIRVCVMSVNPGQAKSRPLFDSLQALAPIRQPADTALRPAIIGGNDLDG